MVDYSRIDFRKLDMKYGSLSLNVGLFGKSCIQVFNELACRIAYKGDASTSDWVYEVVTTWDDLLKLKWITDSVDAFIAAETARIEAEDETANWVAVPWQDVEFLVSSGSTVANSLYIMNPKTVGVPSMEYTADRRTFPPGYDPEKSRWVEVAGLDARRLFQAGCAVAKLSEEKEWIHILLPSGSGEYRYAVDIHTLKPGVPLHEEPKPVSRPCSKEFALLHPRKSEYRYRYNKETEWFNWDNMRSFDDTDGNKITYEFRTTAKAEVKSRIVAEVAVTDTVPMSIAVDRILEMSIKNPVSRHKNPRLVVIVDEES